MCCSLSEITDSTAVLIGNCVLQGVKDPFLFPTHTHVHMQHVYVDTAVCTGRSSDCYRKRLCLYGKACKRFACFSAKRCQFSLCVCVLMWCCLGSNQNRPGTVLSFFLFFYILLVFSNN